MLHRPSEETSLWIDGIDHDTRRRYDNRKHLRKSGVVRQCKQLKSAVKNSWSTSRRSYPPTNSTMPAGNPINSSQTVRSETRDRKSTRLNSSHVAISYAVFWLKK